MVCAPVSQFCCGCSIGFGMKTVLLAHFIINCCLIFQAVMIFFYGGTPHAVKDPGYHLMLTGFSLAGLPIIIAAYHGIAAKTDGFVKIYFYYFLITFLADSFFAIKIFVLSGPCTNLPSIVQEQGKAFACGVARGFDTGIVAAVMGVQLYLLFIVWSYIQDLAMGGGPDLSDLTVDEQALMKKRMDEDPLTSLVGQADYVSAEYGSIYDVGLAGGVGGSSRIFNGRRHDMEFPPNQGFQAGVF